MTGRTDLTPVTQDAEIQRDLVTRYVDDDTPDQQLYDYILSLGIQPPDEVTRLEDKHNIFAVIYTDHTRQTGTLVWDL